MAVQLGAVRDALLEAGASKDAAGKAAEELAGYESQFVGLRQAIADFRSDMDGRFSQFETRFNGIDIRFEQVTGEMTLLKWMIATTLGLVFAIALKLFLH
jgi:hypothetical protein